MMTYCGMENGLASWMPTYAIKAGISRLEDSNFYSMIFWVPNCASRLGWIYVPGSVASRLNTSMNFALISAILSLLPSTG